MVPIYLAVYLAVVVSIGLWLIWRAVEQIAKDIHQMRIDLYNIMNTILLYQNKDLLL